MVMDELLEEEVERLTEGEMSPHVLAADIFRTPVGYLPRAEWVALPEDTPVARAVAAMKAARSTCVLLTDVAGRLSGIFTARDALLRLGGVPVDDESGEISRYMTPRPDALRLDHPIAYALNFMHLGGHRHVPIVDAAGCPVGLVGTREVVAWLSEYFGREVMNLPPNPERPAMPSAEGA